MGYEMTYQAIPEDAPILERARRDPLFGSNLQFFNRYSDNTPSFIEWIGEDVTLRDFAAEVREIVAKRPGILERTVYDGSRVCDMLAFLLSEAYRVSDKPWSELSDLKLRAILGGEILHPETVGVQGIPIRYLSASNTALAATLLAETEFEELKTHWNLEAMEKRGIYKAFNRPGNEENLIYVETLFKDLQNLFRNTADCGEGMLTCFD